MDQTIQNFIEDKRLAVVGVSRRGNKFGNMATKELRERGYQVYVVHPEATDIDGEKCYPKLGSLQEKVDNLLVSVPSKQAAGVLQDASSAGIKNIWLQQGSETNELLTQAGQLGLNVVSGKCILMYAPPVRSFHGFHRFVMKLIGQL